jgi:hypothetical protein
MAENSNIKNFTAVDIEKYHRGLLTPQEKNALEKAALEDPFLADALEGYGIPGLHVSADIQELKKRLSDKIEQTKAIPISAKTTNRFYWWRVAAVILLIAGAGYLVYQVGFSKRSNDIAQSQAGKKNQADDNGFRSGNSNLQNTNQSLSPSGPAEKSNQPDTNANITTTPSPKQPSSIPALTGKNNNSGIAAAQKDNKSPSVFTQDDSEVKEAGIKKTEGKILAATKNPVADGDGVTDISDKSKTAALNKASQEVTTIRRSDIQYRGNIFHGRVLDVNNNAIPFANITNTSDSVGTYADAKGYFSLVSTDSVLDVEVKSVGFNNLNVRLKNTVNDNTVVMEEERTVAEKILMDTAKSNAIKRSMKPITPVEEAEPEDGWGLYDTYVLNNIKVPETIKLNDKKGEVEVYFEIDKNGEPFNFKITKSLCEACDKEAIRLIKEGPKWKRKAKKGRATVTISF